MHVAAGAARLLTDRVRHPARERVLELMKTHLPSARASLDARPSVLTFHALGVRILRDHHSLLGLRRHFTIYDRSDSNRAIKRALELLSVEILCFA